jgi:tetratricopeptide (TPR) repeat protein
MDEAAKVQRQAIAVFDALADDFPDVPNFRVGLAYVLENQVFTLKKLGQLRESEEDCRKALAIWEQLVERYPDVPTYVPRVERAWSNLALILMDCGKHEEGLQIRYRRRDRAREVLRARPGNRDAVFALQLHSWGLALISVEHGDHATAARLILDDLDAYREILDDLDADARGRNALDLGDILVRCIVAAEKDPDLVPERRAATARAYADKLNEMARGSVSRGTPRLKTLYQLADLLSTAPTTSARDPALILELAERAAAMEPDDHMVRQSLSWAQYRNGNWKGCIDSEMKTGHPDEGGFFLAMAYWRLGDKASARTWYDRADKCLQGIEVRFKGREDEVHPSPSMLRQVRDEAAALLGEERPPDRVVADPVPRTTSRPE